MIEGNRWDVVENVCAPRQKPSDATVMHSNSHFNYGRPGAIANQHMFFDTEVFRWVGNPTVTELDDDSKNTMYVDWLRGWQLVKG